MFAQYYYHLLCLSQDDLISKPKMQHVLFRLEKQ